VRASARAREHGDTGASECEGMWESNRGRSECIHVFARPRGAIVPGHGGMRASGRQCVYACMHESAWAEAEPGQDSTGPSTPLTTYRVAMTQISSQQYFAKGGKKIPAAGQDKDTSSYGVADISSHGNEDTSDADRLDTSPEAPTGPRLQSYTVAGNPQTTSLLSTTPGVTTTIHAASTMSDTEGMAEEAGEAESILVDDPGFFDEEGNHRRNTCDLRDAVSVCNLLARLLH